MWKNIENELPNKGEIIRILRYYDIEWLEDIEDERQRQVIKRSNNAFFLGDTEDGWDFIPPPDCGGTYAHLEEVSHYMTYPDFSLHT